MHRTILAAVFCLAWVSCAESGSRAEQTSAANSPAPVRPKADEKPDSDRSRPEKTTSDQTGDQTGPGTAVGCEGLALEAKTLTRVEPSDLHLPDGGFLLTVEIHNRTDQVAEMPTNSKVAVVTTAGEQRSVDEVPALDSWFQSFDLEPKAFRRVSILLPGRFEAGIGSIRIRDIELGKRECVLRRDGIDLRVSAAPETPEPS